MGDKSNSCVRYCIGWVQAGDGSGTGGVQAFTLFRASRRSIHVMWGCAVCGSPALGRRCLLYSGAGVARGSGAGIGDGGDGGGGGGSGGGGRVVRMSGWLAMLIVLFADA